MEGLATNLTRSIVRIFVEKCALEEHTTDETEWTLEGLMADVTEYTKEELFPTKQKSQ